MSPTVSVVIPAYNAAPYISEALDSVLAQTFDDYEIIVVNDGSPDTEALERALAPYRERLFYIAQENRGPSAARNVAIRQARGEYVALLDSDDVWAPRYLAEQMKALRDDQSLDLICADALLFGDSVLAGQTFMQSTPSRSPVTFESLLRWESSVLTSCVVARKQALIDAGLFDERFYRSEDFDLWLRLAHKGGRISYRRQTLARHRLHGASLAADTPRMVQDQEEVLRKLAAELPLSPDMNALITDQIATCRAHYDVHHSKQLFLAGNYDQAAEALRRANESFRSFKLRLVLFGMRTAPRFLHRVYTLRHQALMRGVTKAGESSLDA